MLPGFCISPCLPCTGPSPPGFCWPSLLKQCISGSRSTCHPPGLPGPSLQTHFSYSISPQSVLVPRVAPPHEQDLPFPVSLHQGIFIKEHFSSLSRMLCISEKLSGIEKLYPKIKISNKHCSPLSHQDNHHMVGGYQVSQLHLFSSSPWEHPLIATLQR